MKTSAYGHWPREDLNVHLCGGSRAPQQASLELQHLLDPREGADEPLQGQEEVQGLQPEPGLEGSRLRLTMGEGKSN